MPVLSALVNFYHFVKSDTELKRLTKRSPLRIMIGAGGVIDDGWVPTEARNLNVLVPGHWKRYFKESSIDAMLAEHVWEHLSPEDGLIAAKLCYRYLKPGGYLRVAVPDGFSPDPEYISWVKVNGVGPGADDHKVLYNSKTFSDVFEKAGFKVKLLEYFDSNGTFHFHDWDEREGKICRSKRFDRRNADGALKYTSLILDAIK